MSPTNLWLTSKRDSVPDLEILEEGALAMAQSTIQNAINLSEITRAELARRLGRPRSFISRMLSGDHNLTIRTMARTLLACGYEVRFSIEPLVSSSRLQADRPFIVIEGGQESCSEAAESAPLIAA